jgi:hypothetical protein
VTEGSTCLVGRYVLHQLDNESAATMKVLIVALPPDIDVDYPLPGRSARGETA